MSVLWAVTDTNGGETCFGLILEFATIRLGKNVVSWSVKFKP